MEAEPVGEMATIPDRRLAVFATFSMVHTVAPRVVLNLRHGLPLCTHLAQAIQPDHLCPHSSAESNATTGAVRRFGTSIYRLAGTQVSFLLRGSAHKWVRPGSDNRRT